MGSGNYSDYYTTLLNQRSSLEDERILETQDETDNNFNSEISSQIPQVSVGMGSTSKKARDSNFIVEEDNLIVSAWLNTSIDAVQGSEQKHKTFFRRVWEYFHKYKQFISDRNQNSLMHRWSTIQLATNKFSGCFAQIEARNQSGLTENDRIGQAKLLYQELYNGSFQFEHSWHLLRYQPKWLEEFQKKKNNKTSRTYSPATPESINVEDDDASDNTLADDERPLGRKAEKEKRRKSSNIQSTSSPFLGILTDLKEDRKKKIDFLERTYHLEQERIRQDQERIHQDQERIEIEKARFKAKQVKEEERIILMDLSALSPTKKEYYQRRKMQILGGMKET